MLRKISFQFGRAMMGALLVPSLATAAVNLKKVSIVDGNQIELLFDGKVDPGQVKTEFVRDNIQLSLVNASVYPAKVSMVSGSELTKVFAYQYSPALVRARFTVKGEASDYANRLQVKFSGKTVLVRIAPANTDHVASAAAGALRAVSAPEKTEAKAPETPKTEKVAEKPEAKESKGFFERLADNSGTPKAVAAESDKAVAAVESEKNEKSEKSEKSDKSEKKVAKVKRELGAGKPLPSPFRSIGMMLFVLGIFGLFVMFLKRMKAGGGKAAKSAKGLGGFLSKLNHLSGSGSSKAMIEVVATHHLAPKRSIVVVRVQERMLVLGMTNDSVNLITEFRANDEGEADENIPLGDFAASLKKFENEDFTPSPATKLSSTGLSKANLGDIAAAALGLAKPKPASAPRANAAANAYQSAGTGPSLAAAANSGPAFSPALAETMKQPSVKPNFRAQIKDRVQGMKQL